MLTAAWGLAWRETGSPNARDWLQYATLAGLVLAGVLLSGRAVRPSRSALLALFALVGMAVVETISIVYTPVPSLARDEALLTVFYAAAFAVPALILRTRQDRILASAAIAAGSAGLAVVTALALVVRSRPELLFYGGRLDFPVSYPNGTAALVLIGYWPAVALAARRDSPPVARALAVGGATAMLCAWLLTQSKGGAVALIVSAAAVFALSRRRLRLLVPVAISAGLAALGSIPLTAPIRADDDAALRAAIHQGGALLLWLTAAGCAAGAVYAVLDRSLRLSPASRELASRLAVAGVALALAGGSAAFFAAVESPGSFVSRQWHAFKQQPERETGSTHLLSLGSNRYDFWRVALQEFGGQPLVGIGSRGFGPAYLQHGESRETPARAHSLELDTLAETGLVGLALLVLILAPPLVAAGRRARDDLTAAGALAGGVYFLAHASVDWIWTIPAVGVPAFLLLSVGSATAAQGEPRPVARRLSLAAAGAVALIALIAFVPPWLSARYTQRAARGGPGVAGDVVWAKRLDPLSIEPYVVQATWSPSLPAAIVPLRKAVELQPRSLAARYLLGINLLKAGRRAEAREQLLEAHRLSPRDPFVNEALGLARSPR